MKKHINLILLIIAIVLLSGNFYISYQVNSSLELAQKIVKESKDKVDLKIKEITELKTKFKADKDLMISEFKALIDVANNNHKQTYILYSDKLIKKWQHTLSQEPKYSTKSKASKIAEEQFNRLMAKENIYNQEMLEKLKSVNKNKQ